MVIQIKMKNITGAKFVSNFDRYYATVIYNFENHYL